MSIAYFSSIPESLEEAAMIDGCSRFSALVRVILPISLPGIAAIIVFSFVRAWNEFLMANTLLSSHEKFPATVAFYFFVGYRGTLWHYMCGSILVAAIPTAILFLVIQKWLVSGLTMGAIK
jgi:multiple sugar transport system permease protein